MPVDALAVGEMLAAVIRADRRAGVQARSADGLRYIQDQPGSDRWAPQEDVDARGGADCASFVRYEAELTDRIGVTQTPAGLHVYLIRAGEIWDRCKKAGLDVPDGLYGRRIEIPVGTAPPHDVGGLWGDILGTVGAVAGAVAAAFGQPEIAVALGAGTTAIGSAIDSAVVSGTPKEKTKAVNTKAQEILKEAQPTWWAGINVDSIDPKSIGSALYVASDDSDEMVTALKERLSRPLASETPETLVERIRLMQAIAGMQAGGAEVPLLGKGGEMPATAPAYVETPQTPHTPYFAGAYYEAPYPYFPQQPYYLGEVGCPGTCGVK
jgi:hypothetical protein